jgi:hypothetical protein
MKQCVYMTKALLTRFPEDGAKAKDLKILNDVITHLFKGFMKALEERYGAKDPAEVDSSIRQFLKAAMPGSRVPAIMSPLGHGITGIITIKPTAEKEVLTVILADDREPYGTPNWKPECRLLHETYTDGKIPLVFGQQRTARYIGYLPVVRKEDE